MNKSIIIGRLTKDPELNSTSNGTSVCKFTIAVSGYNDRTDFIDCEAWKNLADNLTKYQKKGNQIAVSGSIRVDNYEDKDGNKRKSTKIIANDIMFLDKKSDVDTGETGEAREYQDLKTTTKTSDPYSDFGNSIEITDDDLPF